jgi:hypothetical protein
MYEDLDWIDPKKALPPFHKDVLVICKGGLVETRWLHEDYREWNAFPGHGEFRVIGWYPLEWL